MYYWQLWHSGGTCVIWGRASVLGSFLGKGGVFGIYGIKSRRPPGQVTQQVGLKPVW